MVLGIMAAVAGRGHWGPRWGRRLHRPPGHGKSFVDKCQTVEDAELLVYLVDEEKDIYIGVLVLVCHFATNLESFQLGRERRKAVLVILQIGVVSCHRMVPVIAACPAIVGTTEAVCQSQRKNARKRHRGAKTNLVISCSNSEIDGCPVVLCD
jgi:hypothetical protein